MERRKPVIIIEHLEESMSLWIILEYRSSSIIYGRENLWFTNIPERYHRVIGKYGKTYCESLVDLVRRNYISVNEILILDPLAGEKLTYKDLLSYKYIVIGGILGDHPPRGRTYKLLTSRLEGVEARNIGDGQYSIDGAVYYVDHLWRNKSMEGFKYVDGVEFDTIYGSKVYLPFRYPIVSGKPLLAPGLIEYLTGKELPREILEELGLS
jgi:ribosome biogenesis SPOUT family RNA methylase Rps3